MATLREVEEGKLGIFFVACGICRTFCGVSLVTLTICYLNKIKEESILTRTSYAWDFIMRLVTPT